MKKKLTLIHNNKFVSYLKAQSFFIEIHKTPTILVYQTLINIIKKNFLILIYVVY